VARLEAVNGSCSSWELAHADGLIRGLLWALTGEDPKRGLTRDTPRIFELAEIKHKVNGDNTVDYDL
jgi:hypothetical protein